MELTKAQQEALITHAKNTMSDAQLIELGLKEKDEWVLLGDGSFIRNPDTYTIKRHKERGNIYPTKEEAELADQKRILLHEMKIFCEEKNGRKIDDFEGLPYWVCINTTKEYNLVYFNGWLSSIWLINIEDFPIFKDKFQDRVKQLKLVI